MVAIWPSLLCSRTRHFQGIDLSSQVEWTRAPLHIPPRDGTRAKPKRDGKQPSFGSPSPEDSRHLILISALTPLSPFAPFGSSSSLWKLTPSCPESVESPSDRAPTQLIPIPLGGFNLSFLSFHTPARPQRHLRPNTYDPSTGSCPLLESEYSSTALPAPSSAESGGTF
jgi:hypothetical protein